MSKSISLHREICRLRINDLSHSLIAELTALLPSISLIGKLTSSDEITFPLAKLVRKQFNAVFVARQDGKIVGFIIAGFDGYRGKFYHLALHPNCNHFETSRLLTEQAIAHLKKHGCQRIMFLIDPAEIEAHQDFLSAIGVTWFEESFTYKVDYSQIASIPPEIDFLLPQVGINDWTLVENQFFKNNPDNWSGVGDNESGFVTFVTHESSKIMIFNNATETVGAAYSATDGCFGSIWHLFVNPQFRSKGIGRSLFQKIRDHQTGLGVTYGTISVVKSNTSITFNLNT